MLQKKEITPEAINEGMTYDQTCWVAIDTSSSEKTKVIFYNPGQAKPDEDFEKFEDFAKYIFEENFKVGKDGPVETDINPNKCTKSACDVKEVGDFCEDLGKSFSTLQADGQIIDVYKGISLEKLPELIKVAQKDLENMEESAKSDYAESADLASDPYRYYGVRRSDFF